MPRAARHLLAVLLTASAAATASDEPVHGITISTHTDGRDWSSELMIPTLRDVKRLGAGWVAIHPYAGIRGDGTVRFH